jgi:hypothetical protein
VLGELPSLVDAFFHVLDVSQDKVLVSSGLFPVLDHVWFESDGDVIAYLSFESGAMPKLQTFRLAFPWKEWRGATPVGMECLSCLQHVSVWLMDTGGNALASLADVPADALADVESAFKSAASVHPGHPSVTVR